MAATYDRRFFPRTKPARCQCCGDPPGSSGLHFDQDPYGEFRGWVCFTCLEELEADDAADVGDAQ